MATATSSHSSSSGGGCTMDTNNHHHSSVSQINVARVGQVLNDETQPMKARFRALFILRNVGGAESIDAITRCFASDSALLKHELGYVLGQMQDTSAVPKLIAVLDNVHENPMVRHEAGEALGAIADESALPSLELHVNDSAQEVSETCRLAINRIKYTKNKDSFSEKLTQNPYYSVDPAPPLPMETTKNVDELRAMLTNENTELWMRYRAMFALRNIGTREAVLALADGLNDRTSALFRHEIAYVLGQIQSDACVAHLWVRLADKSENAMVRHECAEAIGSIASQPCEYILQQFADDPDQVVRESCEVALDIVDYEQSGMFQYATVEGAIHKH